METGLARQTALIGDEGTRIGSTSELVGDPTLAADAARRGAVRSCTEILTWAAGTHGTATDGALSAARLPMTPSAT
jgi:hypothetical protein